MCVQPPKYSETEVLDLLVPPVTFPPSADLNRVAMVNMIQLPVPLTNERHMTKSAYRCQFALVH